MRDATDQPRPAGLAARLLAPFSETERIEPAGATGLVVTVLSVATVLAVAWLALFGSVSQHLHVSWFILLSFPIAFLTTSVAKASPSTSSATMSSGRPDCTTASSSGSSG